MEAILISARSIWRCGWRGATWLLPVWFVLALILTACSTGGTATPTVTIPTIASNRAPTPPATLPPTPPTATVVASRTPAAATPSATTARSAVATATRRPATASPPAPLGAVPPGWQIYRGKLPFAMAYPSDWIVEEQFTQGLVYFYAPVPSRTTFLVLATTGLPEANPNLDVLRDRWFRSRTTSCTRFAIEATGQERYAGVDFVTVGATCDLPAGLAYSHTGIGLRQQVPWIFELNAPYASYDVALAGSFGPMLASWNLYDEAGR